MPPPPPFSLFFSLLANPYVAAVERNLVTTLVENLSLRVISLILEDGLQGPPDIADVTISSVNEADLVILTDDQNPDNPYETYVNHYNTLH